MFRNREPLRITPSTSLTHQEWCKNDQGKGEFCNINDCGWLGDPEDYDLEVQQRAGENLKEVSTILTRSHAVFPTSVENEDVKKSENEDEKEN